MNYEVIKTGSKGNCVRLENMVIDIGIPIKDFPWDKIIDTHGEKFDIHRMLGGKMDYDVVGFVYITHTHSDHVQVTILRRLLELGVPVYTSQKNKLRRSKNPLYTIKTGNRELWDKIVFIDDEFSFDDGYNVYDVKLTDIVPHNVPNFGLHITISNPTDTFKVFYCTDMGDLLGVVAKDYDYYFIEANYCQKRLKELEHFARKKKRFNRYKRSREEHFSKQQCMKFFNANRGENSKLIKLHMSESAYR